ncbi:MAG: tripartite tricarboxylate transporter substrate-binding protein, partial [Hyphomicrobiaceae bacterium]
VPLFQEIYPSINFLGWFGLFAPQGTPDAIVAKLGAEIAKIAKEPDLEPIHRKVALSPVSSTPEGLATALKNDYERFGKIIKDLGIKAE